MSPNADLDSALPAFRAQVQSAASAHPRVSERAYMAVTPGVVDVMGGICEDGGSILVTATLAASIRACGWRTGGNDLVVRLHGPGNDLKVRECSLPIEKLLAADSTDAGLSDIFGRMDAPWAAAAGLSVRRAVIDGLIARPDGGLLILLQTDFADATDLGSPCSTAVAVIETLAQLYNVEAERGKKASIAAQSVVPITGVSRLRIAVTALSGVAAGSFLQLRFVPQFSCDPLLLPDGVTIAAARTVLARPTTLDRLIETRTCAEMGTRMIMDLRKKDGPAVDTKGSHLAAISPSDYVDHYRDRLPSKITAKAYIAQFGTLRGLDGDGDGKAIFKVRSRAEHHIYENRRVHDFATNIARARRLGANEALVQAGELMYASHWSHSQRCGIGGVETDKFVTAVRRRGHAEGLYGAKVTGGGNGGEVVILMRNDDRARAALRAAANEAEAQTGTPVTIYDGSDPQRESFPTAQVSDLLGAAAGV